MKSQFIVMPNAAHPADETKRANCLSHIAAGLLAYYDIVFHTNVDELLVSGGLAKFCLEPAAT